MRRVEDSAAISSLVVVGAATGMGRWLAENLFARFEWLNVTLVDVEGREADLEEAASRFGQAVRLSFVPDIDDGASPASHRTARLVEDGTSALVVVAVPPKQIPTAVAPLRPDLVGGSTVAVISEGLVDAIAAVSAVLPQLDVIGVHPLFERSAPSLEGQIVYVVPPAFNGSSHVELTDLVRAAGGIVKVGEATRHDKIMMYVQAAAQLTLLNIADVLSRADLDLEEDLWATRTPLFESLFGLAARVLDPRQRNAIERIQATEAARQVAKELLVSAHATATTLSDAGVIARRLDEIGDQISGSLFSAARRVADVAVKAAQSTRTELCRRKARRDIVGLRLERRPDVLHIGRILDVGPTDVIIEDLLIPGSGRGGVLAIGPGKANGRKVGANGAAAEVSLNIGQVSLVTGIDLEAELDARLAFVRRDVRFLVPESVSGQGVLRAVEDVEATRGHGLVSDVVRTGQRAVVIGMEIRADNDLDEKVEAIRSRVQQIYAWPKGVCRPAVAGLTRIAYLGPSGTFSEVAARHCAAAAQIKGAELIAADSFADVTAELQHCAVAVVPISSSSSGLVTRAFNALWPVTGRVVVGGMVDVSVRLDAYISATRSLDELRGATLYSHPQALAQCANFIRRWKLTPVPCESTAEALRIVSASADPAVALAAADADLADLDLRVGEREVDDLAGSITRFLILGARTSFGEFSTEHVPTIRSVWLGRSQDPDNKPDVKPLSGEASYQETLVDHDGNFVLITSRPVTADLRGLRLLGAVPWSPRTPVVRVSA